MVRQHYFVQPLGSAIDGVAARSGKSVNAQSPLEADLVLGKALAISGWADQVLANVIWLSEAFQARSMPTFKLAAAD